MTKILSIPRDTWIEIIGKSFEDKINHAYAFGGTELAVQTVEEFLAIPIQYVVRVNMESFVEFIDIVGGIAVQNPFEFDYEEVHFPAGDFGFQNRQRQVIEELIILQVIKNYIEMNLTLKDVRRIQETMMQA